MKIKDFIAELSKYNENIELVIDINGNYLVPSLKKDIVNFKHEVSGTSYIDEAIVLSKI